MVIYWLVKEVYEVRLLGQIEIWIRAVGYFPKLEVGGLEYVPVMVARRPPLKRYRGKAPVVIFKVF